MKIDKSTLPSPQQYLAMFGIKTAGKPKGTWRLIKCPVHKGGQEKNPSMGFNLATGGFFCHACGVKGGDLIDFHRMRTGLNFIQTIKELGGSFHEN